jgi:hypothetical protein
MYGELGSCFLENLQMTMVARLVDSGVTLEGIVFFVIIFGAERVPRGRHRNMCVCPRPQTMADAGQVAFSAVVNGWRPRSRGLIRVGDLSVPLAFVWAKNGESLGESNATFEAHLGVKFELGRSCGQLLIPTIRGETRDAAT